MTKIYAAVFALVFVTPAAFVGQDPALANACCATIEACCEQAMDYCED